MSLKYRIAATIFALEFVVIGTVLWITLGHSMRAVREQIARTEEVTLQLLADLSRAALLTDEFADLETFIEGARRDPRVITVVVGSAEGHVLVATEPELIGTKFPELVVRREHRYWRTADIRGGGSILGTLGIKFSDHLLELCLPGHPQPRYQYRHHRYGGDRGRRRGHGFPPDPAAWRPCRRRGPGRRR